MAKDSDVLLAQLSKDEFGRRSTALQRCFTKWQWSGSGVVDFPFTQQLMCRLARASVGRDARVGRTARLVHQLWRDEVNMEGGDALGVGSIVLDNMQEQTFIEFWQRIMETLTPAEFDIFLTLTDKIAVELVGEITSSKRQRILWQLFTRWDFNGDGALDMDEIEVVLDPSQPPIPPHLRHPRAVLSAAGSSRTAGVPRRSALAIAAPPALGFTKFASFLVDDVLRGHADDATLYRAAERFLQRVEDVRAAATEAHDGHRRAARSNKVMSGPSPIGNADLAVAAAVTVAAADGHRSPSSPVRVEIGEDQSLERELRALEMKAKVLMQRSSSEEHERRKRFMPLGLEGEEPLSPLGILRSTPNSPAKRSALDQGIAQTTVDVLPHRSGTPTRTAALPVRSLSPPPRDVPPLKHVTSAATDTFAYSSALPTQPQPSGADASAVGMEGGVWRDSASDRLRSRRGQQARDGPKAISFLSSPNSFGPSLLDSTMDGGVVFGPGSGALNLTQRSGHAAGNRSRENSPNSRPSSALGRRRDLQESAFEQDWENNKHQRAQEMRAKIAGLGDASAVAVDAEQQKQRDKQRLRQHERSRRAQQRANTGGPNIFDTLGKEWTSEAANMDNVDVHRLEDRHATRKAAQTTVTETLAGEATPITTGWGWADGTRQQYSHTTHTIAVGRPGSAGRSRATVGGGSTVGGRVSPSPARSFVTNNVSTTQSIEHEPNHRAPVLPPTVRAPQPPVTSAATARPQTAGTSRSTPTWETRPASARAPGSTSSLPSQRHVPSPPSTAPESRDSTPPRRARQFTHGSGTRSGSAGIRMPGGDFVSPDERGSGEPEAASLAGKIGREGSVSPIRRGAPSPVPSYGRFSTRSHSPREEAEFALRHALDGITQSELMQFVKLNGMNKEIQEVTIAVLVPLCILLGWADRAPPASRIEELDALTAVQHRIRQDPATFLDELRSASAVHMGPTHLEWARPYVTRAEFDPSVALPVSTLLAALCTWVRAFIHFVCVANNWRSPLPTPRYADE